MILAEIVSEFWQNEANLLLRPRRSATTSGKGDVAGYSRAAIMGEAPSSAARLPVSTSAMGGQTGGAAARALSLA
jgi:hypothetical protein